MAKHIRNNVIYGSDNSLDIKYEATTVKDELDSLNTELGDVTTLETTEKTNTVGAINELNTNIGDISTLTTTEKSSTVGALNEVNAKVPFSLKHEGDEYGYVDEDGNFQAFSAGIDFIAPDFNATETYNQDDFVMHEGLLYKCLEDSVTGAWDSSKWEETKLVDISGGSTPSGSSDVAYLAPVYDESETYNTEDAVIYNGMMYVANEDNITGAWDSSKWEQKSLVEVGELDSNLAPTLLWTNTNLSTAFSGQKVSINTVGYTNFLVEFIDSTDSPTLIRAREYFSKNDNFPQGGGVYAFDSGVFTGAYVRNITAIDNNGITFSDGFPANKNILPYKIWGFKNNILS